MDSLVLLFINGMKSCVFLSLEGCRLRFELTLQIRVANHQHTTFNVQNPWTCHFTHLWQHPSCMWLGNNMVCRQPAADRPALGHLGGKFPAKPVHAVEHRGFSHVSYRAFGAVGVWVVRQGGAGWRFGLCWRQAVLVPILSQQCVVSWPSYM